jgi:hypothetical protein
LSSAWLDEIEPHLLDGGRSKQAMMSSSGPDA